MLKKCIAHSLILLSIGAMVGSSFVITPASAVETPILSSLSSQLKIFNFFNRRRPNLSQRAGGNRGANSHRGACSALPETNVRVLVPDDDGELTTEAFPTFWLHMPYTRTSGVAGAKFVLLDEDLQIVVEPIDVPLPDSPGVISFQLPNTVAPLEVGKSYNWYFSVICDAEKPSRNPVVSGWVERVAPSVELTNQLRVTPIGREYITYGRNSIWFDAVTQLAQQRCRVPQNSALEADWRTLLQRIELERLSTQPVVCSTS